MKDIIQVNIGEDHIFNCDRKKIARTGESSVTRLEIALEENLSECWAYLDFKKANGETVKTPKLEIVDNRAVYDIPLGVLDVVGDLEVQLVLQRESGEIWKSDVKKFFVCKSINATDDIPDKEDFITEAQKLLDELGDVETALDGIIAIQNELIGGDTE